MTMTELLTITVQGTPNPNAAKFTLNRVVAERGVTYRDAATTDIEWARRLLGIAGVTQIFALNNFISVTKTSDVDWQDIGAHVESILRQAFA